MPGKRLKGRIALGTGAKMQNSGFQAVENDPEHDPQNDAQKGPRSPKRVLPYFLIQTLKRKRPKNDPRENEENTLNEC